MSASLTLNKFSIGECGKVPTVDPAFTGIEPVDHETSALPLGQCLPRNYISALATVTAVEHLYFNWLFFAVVS